MLLLLVQLNVGEVVVLVAGRKSVIAWMSSKQDQAVTDSSWEEGHGTGVTQWGLALNLGAHNWGLALKLSKELAQSSISTAQ